MKKIFYIKEREFYFDCDNIELYVDKCYIKNEKIIESKNVKQSSKEIVHINLTENCNANCSYCYQEHNNNSIDYNDYKKILNSIDGLESIKKIVFFGGEPLLKKELIIQTILRYKNKLKYEITTNGILLDEDILKLFKDYDVQVIISFDGPEEIHNALRKGAEHKKLLEVFGLIYEMNMKSNTHINCTYTKLHEENIGIENLKKYLSSFGFEYTINNVITENLNLKLKEHTTSIKYIIDQDIQTLINKKSKNINKYLSDIIVSLIERNKNYYFCQDAEKTLYFDIKCQKRFCNATFNMGFTEEQVIASINRKNDFNCNNCWAKYICSSCPVKIFKNKQNIVNCKMKKNYDYAMEKILEVYLESAEKFETILGNYIYYE